MPAPGQVTPPWAWPQTSMFGTVEAKLVAVVVVVVAVILEVEVTVEEPFCKGASAYRSMEVLEMEGRTAQLESRPENWRRQVAGSQ